MKERNTRKCVVCGRREVGSLQKFHKFPKDPVRCTTWLTALGMKEGLKRSTALYKSHLRVCSVHFKGQMSGKKHLLKNAVPETASPQGPQLTISSEPPHLPVPVPAPAPELTPVNTQTTPEHLLDHSYCSTEDMTTACGSSFRSQQTLSSQQTLNSQQQVLRTQSVLRGKITKKKSKSRGTQRTPLRRRHASIQAIVKSHNKGVQVSRSKADEILEDDSMMKKYTGIENISLFNILHEYLTCTNECQNECEISAHSKSNCPHNVFKKISTVKQLLLVLYKLKRNPIDSILGSEFGLSTGRVSELFQFWIRLMFRKFKLIKIWPAKEQVHKHVPDTTRKHFPDLVCISDCVEFSTQAPGGPLANKLMFSHYKNCHTAKVMYSTAPNGALIHCSDVFGGIASDKEIFTNSDIPKRLQTGDGLMVDKGFLIRDAIQGKGIKLYRPPFLSGSKQQLSSEERESGRLIARSRIIVENFNARIATFAFLKQKKIPVLYLPLMNEICFVCGFLANLGPLIRH